jgi:hypothetical protein
VVAVNSSNRIEVNILRQSNSTPEISAWEAFDGAFSYNHTPLGQLGCRFVIHKKVGVRYTWDFRGNEGWGVGVSKWHYRCQRVVAKATKAEQISDTVEFRHQYLTQPTITSDDRVLHSMQNLTGALKDAPTVACDTQLQAIAELRNVLRDWSGQKAISRAQPPTKVPHAVLPRVRDEKLSDMSENLGALRAMPKESITNIESPIPSPWNSPSVSPPRVPKPSGRESPRIPDRISRIIVGPFAPEWKKEESPIATRTRSRQTVPVPLQRQSEVDKPIASRT